MKELQEKLQELGLTGREAEVYLALFQKKELSAPEISKITTITRTKSYEILQNLIKKRVCNEKYKNGTKVFSSVEPTIAIQNLLLTYEEELNRKKKLAEQFREHLVELHKIKEKNNDPIDYIEVLTDIGLIRTRWINIQKNTKKELLGFTKPPYAVIPENNIKTAREVLRKKIVIKSIYEYKHLASFEEKKNFIEVIESYQKLGEEAKIMYELPMKLVICDEKITMLALTDRISMEPSITTIIIDHPNYAKAQKEVFEVYWSKAISLEDFKNLDIVYNIKTAVMNKDQKF